jgi:hypothetical protein
MLYKTVFKPLGRGIFQCRVGLVCGRDTDWKMKYLEKRAAYLKETRFFLV